MFCFCVVTNQHKGGIFFGWPPEFVLLKVLLEHWCVGFQVFAAASSHSLSDKGVPVWLVKAAVTPPPLLFVFGRFLNQHLLIPFFILEADFFASCRTFLLDKESPSFWGDEGGRGKGGVVNFSVTTEVLVDAQVTGNGPRVDQRLSSMISDLDRPVLDSCDCCEQPPLFTFLFSVPHCLCLRDAQHDQSLWAVVFYVHFATHLSELGAEVVAWWYDAICFASLWGTTQSEADDSFAFRVVTRGLTHPRSNCFALGPVFSLVPLARVPGSVPRQETWLVSA